MLESPGDVYVKILTARTNCHSKFAVSSHHYYIAYLRRYCDLFWRVIGCQ